MAEQNGLTEFPGSVPISGPGNVINRALREWFGSLSVWIRRINEIRENDVSDPPTQAEMVTAFGSANNAGHGAIGVLNDDSADTNVRICIALDGNWFYSGKYTKGA